MEGYRFCTLGFGAFLNYGVATPAGRYFEISAMNPLDSGWVEFDDFAGSKETQIDDPELAKRLLAGLRSDLGEDI